MEEGPVTVEKSVEVDSGDPATKSVRVKIAR